MQGCEAKLDKLHEAKHSLSRLGDLECAAELTSRFEDACPTTRIAAEEHPNESETFRLMRLLWHSHGSSTAAKGASGHEFQILTVYTEPGWGAPSIPYGWCLQVDGEVVHFDRSYQACKKVAGHIEKDSAKAPF